MSTGSGRSGPYCLLPDPYEKSLRDMAVSPFRVFGYSHASLLSSHPISMDTLSIDPLTAGKASAAAALPQTLSTLETTPILMASRMQECQTP